MGGLHHRQVWDRARHTGKMKNSGLDLFYYSLPLPLFLHYTALTFTFAVLAGFTDVQSLLHCGMWTASMAGNVVQTGIDMANQRELFQYKQPWWFYLLAILCNILGHSAYTLLTRKADVKRPGILCSVQFFVIFEVIYMLLQADWDRRQKLWEKAHDPGDGYGPRPWQALVMSASFGVVDGFTTDGPLACRVCTCSAHFWRISALLCSDYFLEERPKHEWEWPSSSSESGEEEAGGGKNGVVAEASISKTEKPTKRMNKARNRYRGSKKHASAINRPYLCSRRALHGLPRIFSAIVGLLVGAVAGAVMFAQFSSARRWAWVVALFKIPVIVTLYLAHDYWFLPAATAWVLRCEKAFGGENGSPNTKNAGATEAEGAGQAHIDESCGADDIEQRGSQTSSVTRRRRGADRASASSSAGRSSGPVEEGAPLLPPLTNGKHGHNRVK